MVDVSHLFPGAVGTPYLNTASMALGNEPGASALTKAVDEWTRGVFDWVGAEAVAEELRETIASLLGVPGDDIAFVTGAAGGASTIAAQLPPADRGENIVVPMRDFASNFLPWKLLADQGYELRLVPDANGEIAIDAFASCIDPRTAVIATSVVQSVSGFRVNLDALKVLAHDARAWLVLDASQALGSIDITTEGVHALFSCSHKWLCGVRGMGYLWVDPQIHATFRPISPGWKATVRPMESFYGPSMDLAETARKLDFSSPWFDPLVNIEGARIITDVGVGTIEDHNLSLVSRLESEGLEIPFAPANRSPIVSIEVDDPDRAIAGLRERGIVASVRSGRLRVSFHLYNTIADADAVISSIK